VLIVDDEHLIRLVGCDMLEQGGYRVLEAADAAGALQCLEDGAEVLVLFTDINMPGPLDGLDLAKLVNDRWPQVKILVTSGHIRPERTELPEAGLFLSKPYRAEELLAMLRELTRD
jgi:CheY-like chemotaxis protein